MENDNKRVIIFDTTLRDGEQSPGASMNTAEKLRLAVQLEKLGVDVIEAGFPAASDGDFDAVSQIAAKLKRAQIAGLARATRSDIDRAWEAIKHAAHPRIHTFIATSDIHLEYKLRMSREEVVQAAVAAVKHARSYTDNVEFSAEDGSRSDWDFLCRVFEAAIADDPDDARAWLDLGLTLEAREDFQGALAAYQRSATRSAIRYEAWIGRSLAVRRASA